MTTTDLRALVGSALDILGGALARFVATVPVPDGYQTWVQVLAAKDAQTGKSRGHYRAEDPAVLLRLITERLGDHGYPFNPVLSHDGRTYAQEVRPARNHWAHGATFDTRTTERALSTMSLLALEVADPDAAARIDALRLEAALSPLGPTSLPLEVPTSTTAPTPTGVHVQVTLDAMSTVSYAVLTTGRPVVRGVHLATSGARGPVSVHLTLRAAAHTGPLGDEVTWPVTLRNGTTRLDPPALALAPARLLALTEEQAGTIEVTVTDDQGTTLATGRTDVRLLPANHWAGGSTPEGVHGLAAHVQPNAHAVQVVLRGAADHLKASTGSASLAPDPADPERADQLAQAIYDTLAEADIAYVLPPASWERGQKVRTPDEVLDTRLGTCLDTTVTMASAMEQAGVPTMIWLLPAHAFVGYWRTSARPELTADLPTMVRLLAAGNVAVVETTVLTHTTPRSFADAQTCAAQQIVDHGLEAITDLTTARALGVLPLPTPPAAAPTPHDPDGADSDEPVPAAGPDDHADGDDPAPATETMPVHVTTTPTQAPNPGPEDRCQSWIRQLLDTTRSNPAIHLPDTHVLPLAGADQAPTLLTELLAGQTVHVTPRGPANLPTQMARQARTGREETGAHCLYITAGMLHWTSDGHQLRSPLWLLPVDAEISATGALTLTAAHDATPVHNQALAIRLERDGRPTAWPAPAPTDPLALAHHVSAHTGLRVDPCAALVVLSTAHDQLAADLQRGRDAFMTNALVAHLHDTPLVPFTDPGAAPVDVDLDWLTGQLPLPADGAQVAAIAAATNLNTQVLYGPPGTGKTTTLANAAAEAIARGLKVAIVSSKRGALDLPADLLTELGLQAWCLDLHTAPPTPRQLHDRLTAMLNQPPDELVPAAGADLERRNLRRHLRAHTCPSPAGYTLPAAFDAAHRPAPTGTPLASCTPADVARLRESGPRVADLAARARASATHPWRFLAGAHRDTARLCGAARDLDAALTAAQRDGIDPQDLAAADTSEGLRTLATLTSLPTQDPHGWCALLQDPTLAVPALHALDALAAQATTMPEGVAHHTRWSLRTLLTAPPDDQSPASASTAAAARALAALPVTLDADLTTPAGAAAARERLTELVRIAEQLRDAHTSPGTARRLAAVTGHPAATAALTRAADAWDTLTPDLTVTRSHYLPRRWLATPSTRKTATLDTWLELLTELDAWADAGLDALRSAVLDGDINPADLTTELEQALAAASITERLNATGLDHFDHAVHSARLERYATHLDHARATAPARIHAQATATWVTDDPAWGAARRALTRRGATLEQVLAQHGPTLLRAFRCVLAAPQDIARYLPAAPGLFDLVIFDEASQIRVAEAIGALGRSRAALIIGDPAQMPPAPWRTDLEGFDTLPDEESILDEAIMAGVPTRTLTEHYRSRHHTLIAFSNARYYADRLSVAPSPDPAGALQVLRTDGQFIRRGAGLHTNPVEAQAVVDHIRARFEDTDHVPSLGVVTFNRPQRDLILTMLTDLHDPRIDAALTARDGLFVKNLENVQGDERDEVVLSVGYSPTPAGLVPATMGSLSTSGGWRRLNVALSRARDRMLIITSFDPDQLHVSPGTARAVTDLRDFLAFATAGGATPLTAPTTTRLHREVAAALRAAGYDVHTGAGTGTFAVHLVVTDPRTGAGPLAIQLTPTGVDDRRRSPTIVDAELAGPRALTARGWAAIATVRLIQWLTDPAAVIAQVTAAVDATRPARELVTW